MNDFENNRKLTATVSLNHAERIEDAHLAAAMKLLPQIVRDAELRASLTLVIGACDGGYVYIPTFS